MESFKVLVSCLLFQGVSTLVAKTFPGAAIRLDMKTHVATVNQSYSFMFEVQSCDTVNLTLLALHRAERIDINIHYGQINISSCFPEDSETSLKCTSPAQNSFTPGSCSITKEFWIYVDNGIGIYRYIDVGEGCDEDGNYISFISIGHTGSDSEIDFHHEVLVASDGDATWKFGEDACAPTTPNSTTTTTAATTATTPTTSKGSDNGHLDLTCKSAGMTIVYIPGHLSKFILFLLFLFKHI